MKFFEKFKFKCSPELSSDAHLEVWYVEGVSVFIFDWDSRRISGFSYRIKVGDEVRVPMQSGNIARLRVTSINRMSDPKDQYFGTVEDIGYI